MDLSIPTPPTIETLRARIARIEHGAVRPRGLALSLGPSIDAALPGGGLTLGALHEAAGAGPDTEHGAAAALFVAGILARQHGPVLWVLEQPTCSPPAWPAAGLHPDRVIYAEAGKPDAVLQAMEEGLRHPGLAGVVGEIGGRLTLTASRRLQLAAETVRHHRLRPAPQPQARRPGAGGADRRGHKLADRRAALAAALAARARHARPGAAALAAGPDALPRRRGTEILDRGGMRCDGSSRSGCRRWRRIGCAGTRNVPAARSG